MVESPMLIIRLGLITSASRIGSDQPKRNDQHRDRKSTRLNSSHMSNTYAAFCLKNKTWREPRSAPLFALGPLLAPLSALGLLPLATLGLRSPLRRGLQVAAGVVTAGVVAGIRGS